MTIIIRKMWAHPVKVLAATWLLGSGVACNSLWVLDAPRPTLKENDRFDVLPTCPDLVIDPNAIASANRLITLTGRRAETNLGAESVPVDVHIGPCCQGEPAGDADTAADYSSSNMAGLVDASLRSGACGDSADLACSASFVPFGSQGSDLFELVPQSGCRSRSPSQLDCTLDPNGEAAFSISFRGSSDTISPDLVRAYLPICVTPAAEADGGLVNGLHQHEVHVIPREGTARFALAVVQVATGDQPTASDASDSSVPCDGLLHCDELLPRARFQAGIVSADIPPSDIRDSDFLQVEREVPFSVDLATLSALTNPIGPFLSKTDCTRAEAGTTTALSLSVVQGHRSTEPFFLCAPPKEASYRITPFEDSGDTAMPDSGTTSNARSNALFGRALDLTQKALPGAYFVEPSGGQNILFVQACGGSAMRAPVGSVSIVSPLTVINGAVVLGCATSGSGPLSDASDVADAFAAAAPDGGSTCSPVTLELTSGGTCSLNP